MRSELATIYIYIYIRKTLATDTRHSLWYILILILLIEKIISWQDARSFSEEASRKIAYWKWESLSYNFYRKYQKISLLRPYLDNILSLFNRTSHSLIQFYFDNVLSKCRLWSVHYLPSDMILEKELSNVIGIYRKVWAHLIDSAYCVN